MMDKILSFIPSPWILFLISALILIFCLTRKNNNFFDIRDIVRQHFKIFNGNIFIIFVTYGIPLIMSLATLKLKTIDKDVINNLVIVISILLSMFFAMISILYSIAIKKDENGNCAKLLKETINTILYNCVLSIILLIISFAVLFIDKYTINWEVLIVSLMVYYLTYVVVLNVFIIVKRLKELFNDTV